MYTELSYELVDNVGTITLQRPEARNALTFTTYPELEDAVRTSTARCLIITGADPALKDEYVVYTAHWDHFGIGTPVDGDPIYHGARDNASGTAMLVEFAREFKKVRPAPKRTMLFVAVTGEEQGLLGSDYLAHHLPVPAGNISMAMNFDGIRPDGIPERDVLHVPGGLADYLQTALDERGTHTETAFVGEVE